MKNKNLISQKNKEELSNDGWIITRRDFLKISVLTTAGICTGLSSANASFLNSQSNLSFGIVTDPHYAEIPDINGKYYSKSLYKMNECVSLMNNKKVDFLIELGDFKDLSQPASEKETINYLKAIEKVFTQFNGPRYHVMGNHDTDCLSKKQFLSYIKNTDIPQAKKFYSFERMGIHFIVLDANYLSDGRDYDHGNWDWTDANIPEKEIMWLREDLSSTKKPVIVFAHQLLDGKGSHYVNNAIDVRQELDNSGKVLAVFQGHYHEGSYSKINDIHYYTLKAMVTGDGKKNNSYAIVKVYNDHINITGYRKAVDKKCIIR